MNNFEVIRVFDKMLNQTKSASIYMRASFLNNTVIIDKNDL